MKLPAFMHHWIVKHATKITFSRPPDVVLTEKAPPGEQLAIYLQRWYVIPHNRFFNIYVHHFMRSDEDRALHDHPWPSMSILLVGRYLEHMPNGKSAIRSEGHFYVRRASAAHRIELLDIYNRNKTAQVLTLFITGPHVREWGFLCPNGWRHWKQFTKEGPNQKSIGCGEFK